MLDLEYIKANTLWVIKYESGYRRTVKGSEVDKYRNDEDIDDVDTVWWKGQPADLQEFWKAYEYANYHMDRHDLFFIDDFYREWSKNPNQFKADHRKVISTLRKELDNLLSMAKQQKLNICVVNYDKHAIGNHYFENWISALKLMEDDFDVVEVNIYGEDVDITIQCDDYDLYEHLSYLSNKAALESSFN